MLRLSRRTFINKIILGLITIPIFRSVTVLAKVKSEPLPPGGVTVPDSDPVALALGYKPNVKDIDYTRFPQRKTLEAKNQFCKFCANYIPANEGWGKCLIITSGLVSSGGWCESWTKKV